MVLVTLPVRSVICTTNGAFQDVASTTLLVTMAELHGEARTLNITDLQPIEAINCNRALTHGWPFGPRNWPAMSLIREVVILGGGTWTRSYS